MFKTHKKTRKNSRASSLVPAAMLVVLLSVSLLAPAPTNAGFFSTFVQDWKSMVATMTQKSLSLFSREPQVTILQQDTSPPNTTKPSPTQKKKNTPTPTFTQTALPRSQPTLTTTKQPQTTLSPIDQGVISRLEALEVQIAAVLKTTEQTTNTTTTTTNTSNTPTPPLPPTIDTFSNTEQDILNTAFAHTAKSHATLSSQLNNNYKTLESYVNRQIQNSANTQAITVIGPSNTIPTLDAILTKGSTATKAVTFQGGVTFDSAATFSNTTVFTGSSTFDTNTLTIDAANNRVGIATTTPTDTFSLNGPAYLSQITAPANTTNRLYNNAGSLYWAGSLIGGASTGNWTTDGTHVYRTTGNVGIATTSPYAKLSVSGNAAIDGTLTASTFTATSTTATSTLLSLTATNLEATGNAIFNTITSGIWQGTAIADAYLTKTGDWTGTFDGQEGSYYQNANNLTNFGNPFYTYFNATTTDALSEGATNQYWTNTRFDNRLSATTTLPNLTTLANLATIGTITSGTWNSTAIDISDYTNLTAGTNITLSGDTLNVDDAFLSNTGDTATGNYTFDTDTLTIDATNNRVGIGTASPGSKLHIVGTESTGGSAGFTTLTVYDDTSQTTGVGGRIIFGSKYNDAGAYTVGAGVAVEKENATSGNYDYGLSFFTRLTGGSTLTEQMRITSSGNVGIATTSPYAKLSVAGQVVGEYFTATSTNATSTFNGDVQFANNPSALASANYPLQFLSGVADGGSAVGYVFDTTNTLSTSGSITHSFRNSGTELFSFRQDANRGSEILKDGNVFIHKSQGTNSLFIGLNSGQTSTGDASLGIGDNTLSNQTSGFFNVAIGYQAMENMTTGTRNYAIGRQSLRYNETGTQNTVLGDVGGLGSFGASNFSNTTLVGFQAGMSLLTNGNYNTFIGNVAGKFVTTGTRNVLIGYQAGFGMTTGSNNIMIGDRIGDNLTTGANNIILGYDIDAPSATSANTLNIGNLLYGTGIDGTGTTISSGNIGIGTTTPTAKLEISGTTPMVNVYDAANSAADIKIGAVTPGGGLYYPGVWFRQSAPDVTNYAFLADGDNTTIFNTPSGKDMRFRVGNANKMILQSTGNLGIATTSPYAKLSIEHTAGSVPFAIGSSTASTLRVDAAGSLIVGAPTGGGKGYGTINAGAVYDDNTLLTDYVFDKYYDGTVLPEDEELHGDYTMLTLTEMEDFVQTNRHLPTITGRDEWVALGGISLGRLATQLWETAETNSLYILELNKKISDLEMNLQSTSIADGSGGSYSLLDGLKEWGVVLKQGLVNVKQLVTGELKIEQEQNTDKPTIGEGLVRAGQDRVFISSKAVQQGSRIFVTPALPVSIAVSEKQGGVGFMVQLETNAAQDVKFDWWIVQTSVAQQEVVVEPTPDPAPQPTPDPTPDLEPDPDPAAEEPTPETEQPVDTTDVPAEDTLTDTQLTEEPQPSTEESVPTEETAPAVVEETPVVETTDPPSGEVVEEPVVVAESGGGTEENGNI